MLGLKERPRARDGRFATKEEGKRESYLRPLEEALSSAQAVAQERRDYLQRAKAMGVQATAIDTLGETLVQDSRTVRQAERVLTRIRAALDAGCEPTTPPRQWFCGTVTERKRSLGMRMAGVALEETWPNVDDGRGWTTGMRTFTGAIPIEALQQMARVQPLMDDMRVYSPRREDFRETPRSEPIDPVLIGRIRYLDRWEYFEIARWDVDKDLAALFTRL